MCHVERPIELFRKGKGVRRVCRDCRQAQRRAREGGEPCHERLPVGPFRDWLRSKLGQHECMRDFAARMRLCEDTVYRILNPHKRDGYGKKYVWLETVDRALTAEGEQWLLEEWYPLKEDM